MKKYVIYGGSGFLGEHLVSYLSSMNDVEITAVARNEGKLIALKEKFPHVEIIPGDIADQWIVRKTMQGKDGVFLLSAVKSVDIAEREVHQTIRTNVYGTMRVLAQSYISKPEFVVVTSTDKAAQVTGVYGATKLLVERLFREAEAINPATNYRIVRYGNVLGSTGSVVVKWKQKMEDGEGVSITDQDMTRFFWPVDEAIDLIFQCLETAEDATPFMPEMKAMRMGDLLEAMMQKYGRVPVTVIGNRGGENMHETLDGKTFSNQVEKFSIEEIKEMI